MSYGKAAPAEYSARNTIMVNLAGLKYEVDQSRDELTFVMPTEPVDMSEFLAQFSDYSAREQDLLGFEILTTIRAFQLKQLLADRII